MSIDILPTVLDLLNIDFEPTRFDGRSLCPAIKDADTFGNERLLYSEHMNRFAVSVRNEKIAVIKGLETREYSSTYRFEKDKVELYDLQKDPLEANDIALKNPEVTKEFDRLLLAWLKDRRVLTDSIKKPKVSEEVKEKLKALGYAH